MRRSGFSNYFKHGELMLMFLPGLLLIFVFGYIPMAGLIAAFKDFRLSLGILNSPWSGLDTFRTLFGSADFPAALRNTLIISGLRLTIGFVAPILFALLLNEIRNKWFGKFVQTATYLPYFFSWVVLGGIFQMVLARSGPVNDMVGVMGFGPIPFLTQDHWFIFTLISTAIWQGVGYGAVIYLAALAGIDPGLYEAAKIDGANKLHQIRHITLPMLTPTIVILFILQIGQILSAGFDQIFNLYNPSVYDVADVIDTYVLRRLLTMDFSLATAAGLFKSGVGLILVVGAIMSPGRSAKENPAYGNTFFRPEKEPDKTMNESRGEKIFGVGNTILLTLFAFGALYPFIYTISMSLSTTAEAYRPGLHLYPREVTFEAYRMIVGNPEIITGYLNTIGRTVFGTLGTLLFTCMCAYPLSRPYMPHRGFYIFIIVFTMLFSGGIVPTYLLIKELDLINNRLVYIIPLLVSAFNVIVVKNFFEQIPDSYSEAARIDGAGEFRILFQIFIPLSAPVLATVGLWTAIMHWNMWFDAMIYVTDNDKQVMQTFLQRIVIDNSVELADKGFMDRRGVALATETLKAATVVITILPMLLLYPFVQKYFTKGIHLGGVKG